MIALIDYGMGNLGSVSHALHAVGAEWKLVTTPEEAASCQALLLPGVGNFGDGMHNLAAAGWPDFLRDAAKADKPMLGICLGMQMMFDSSEEASGVTGLGIIPGKVRRFDTSVGKVPHMGWNAVEVLHDPAGILRDVSRQSEFFYFVHSFYVVPDDSLYSCGVTTYGNCKFTAIAGRGNLLATQFHPEKSQQAGLSILKRFAELAKTR